MELGRMASLLMLNMIDLDKLTTEHLEKIGWQYRRKKSIEDIKHAMVKARNPKNGFHKIEHEIEMMELYLKDILKKKKVK